VLRKFVRDLALYAPARVLPAFTAFITTPILTRLLRTSEYGYWAQASSISGFLVALVASGFGTAAIRFYPAYQARSTLAVLVASLTFSTGVVVLVVTAISFLLLFLLKNLLPAGLSSLLPLIVLIFGAQSLFTLFISFIRAQGRSGAYTIFQLLQTYGGLGIGLALAAGLGLGVEGLLWGTLLAVVVVLPFLIVLVTRETGMAPQHARLADARQLWEYAWPLTVGNTAMWALRVSDLFVIGRFGSASDVGLYSVSYNLSAKSIELLVALFLLSYGPLVSSTFERVGKEATEATLAMVTRVYLTLCLPASVGLSILAFPVVSMLTTPAYYEGSKIVGFVTFSSFVWGLAQIATMGMVIGKQTRRLALNQVVAGSTHICLMLLLVPHFGYVAAAVSTLIGYSVLLALQILGSRPYLRWGFPFSTMRNATAASVLMGVATWGTYALLGNAGKGSPGLLLLTLLVAVPTYFGSLWWLGEVKATEKKVVLQLCSRVLGR
jgi:O-antigen/teichoic acid export membrane protein